MYFLLNIHKLRRSVTRRDLVSETINMISCGAPSCGFRYLLSLLQVAEFETGSGYPGNCNHVPGP